MGRGRDAGTCVHYLHLKQAKDKLETELLFSQRYQNIRD